MKRREPFIPPRTSSGVIARRDFLAKAVAGGAVVVAAGAGVAGGLRLLQAEEAPEKRDAPKEKARRSATDKVPLGSTKVQVTRLAMGTGSNGGQVQRDLGQEAFTRLIRHGYDRGLRFIDAADAYKTHGMIREAIKGLPREELSIQTKMGWQDNPDVAKELDRFRKELGVDYLDIVLLHNTDQKGWPRSLERCRDQLSAAKEKGIVRAVGVSVHGLPGLREVAGCKWVEVALLRINHKGRHMDGPTGEWDEPSPMEEAVAEIAKIHRAGKAVIGMKLIGNGDFTGADEREKSIRYVLTRPFVDAVDVGFKSPGEIDEAIERIDRALSTGRQERLKT